MRSANRWAMLSLGMAGQGAGCVFVYGLPFLLPTFESKLGLTLAQAGILVGAPSAGMLATLIAWGWLADRYGERLAMTAGLGGGGVLLAGAAFTDHPVALAVLLALAGAAAAATNAASGRVVLGWFPKDRRGVAMGLRQTAQPLGVAVAGVIVPQFATVRGALLVMAGLCLVTALAVGLLVVDPPRPAPAPGVRAASPYGNGGLWRVHGASMLLVVPQFTTSAFALTYLISAQGWNPAAAGALISATQFAGAGGRLLCGTWSDRVGSRLRPMRQLAVTNAMVVGLLAAAAATPWGVPLIVAALAVSMSGNGLAFTAVSELAGAAWAGRALGVQNTGQNLVAAATPGVVGALISGHGFAPAFALAALLALAASAVTPRDPAPAEAAA